MATPTTPARSRRTAARSAPDQRMRAIVQTQYGTADTLRIAEIDRPAIDVARRTAEETHAALCRAGIWTVNYRRLRVLARRPT